MSKSDKRTIIVAGVALVLCMGMNAYFYSLEGARGFYVWWNTSLLRWLFAMGLIPLTVALLAFPLGKLASKKPAAAVRGISLALSALVCVASIGITVLLVVGPRQGKVEPARLELIDPGLGIAARGSSAGQALMSSGLSGGDGAAGAASPTSASGAAETGVPAVFLRLSFSSDPHWGADTSDAAARDEILASVAEHRPDAFFMLGDTVQTGSSSTQWNSALADLEAIIPKVPLRVLMGNHDALLGGQYLYRTIFFPKGFSSDSGSPYYYSIDAGSALIVVLDLPWGTENFGNKQRSWLEKTLAAADPSKPLIVLSHSFFYASGYDDPDMDKPWYDHRENIPAIAPLFEKYGVDLVVSGHNHYQELLEHAGVTYVVVGAMGGIPDPAPSYISPAQVWMAPPASFGRLDVDVAPGKLLLSFRDAAGGLLKEAVVPYLR
ncbi:MAG: metallophosphoesterase [Rectinemataceae bacterium]